MLQVRWSLNSNNTAKRKRMASSFKPTAKNSGGSMPLPEAPWAITSSFHPGMPKPERRAEPEALYHDNAFSQGSAPSSPSPPLGEVGSSGRAAKRQSVGYGNGSCYVPPKPLAMHDMEPADCFDPITLFTSSNAADLDDLSSLTTLTAGALAMPTFMPIQMMPKFLPHAPAPSQTERAATTPPEDATQKGSPCPSPTHISAMEEEEEEAHLAEMDSKAPLDMLQLDDISSLLVAWRTDGGAGDLDLGLADESAESEGTTQLCVNVEVATGNDGDSPNLQLEMPSPESVQLELGESSSARHSKPSAGAMLSFEGQVDFLAGLEALDNGEMPMPLANLPPLPPPLPTARTSSSGASSSSAPRRPTFPLQQADIVRMLNGELPLGGDADEMDLIMQMSALPQDASFFNMESILMSDSLPPIPPMGLSQTMPSIPKQFSRSLPPLMSVGKPMGYRMPPGGASMDAQLPMPPINPPVKRTSWVHCDAEGKEAKSAPKESKAAAAKVKAEAAGGAEGPKAAGKPSKSQMRDLMVPFPPPSDASSAGSCSTPSMATQQFSTPFVPPSRMTSDAVKPGQAHPPHQLQQLVLNNAHPQMVHMGAMRDMGASIGADLMSKQQPMVKQQQDKKKGKGFSWQSLKVFPSK